MATKKTEILRIEKIRFLRCMSVPLMGVGGHLYGDRFRRANERATETRNTIQLRAIAQNR